MGTQGGIDKMTFNEIKQFFIDEFTTKKCEIHNQKIELYVGCPECYREKIKEARRLDRIDRINEIKEAVILAHKEIQEQRTDK